jgi:hypothetical protein
VALDFQRNQIIALYRCMKEEQVQRARCKFNVLELPQAELLQERATSEAKKFSMAKERFANRIFKLQKIVKICADARYYKMSWTP